MNAIQFLTRVGHACSPIRQEFILLSDVLGVSALVDNLNNPVVGGATDNSVFGPFFTTDAPDGMFQRWYILYWMLGITIGRSVEMGGSIASEGKGEYMYVEGRVLNTDGKPIPDAVIETWEADADGMFSVLLNS
jgi:protocatechuate 3,4-dioxygenase beta subunit